MRRAATVLLAWALAAAAHAGAPTETFPFGRVGPVAVYAPEGPPQSVVLFVSGDGGWNQGVVSMAERLRGQGALVAGIDIRRFQKAADAAPCFYPAGDLEELSRALQLRRKLPRYQRPILAGYSSGATLVYLAIATAPPETFAGAISLGFCPDIEIRHPPCRSTKLAWTPRKPRGFDLGVAKDVPVPWMVLQGDVDKVCNPPATKAFVDQVPKARMFWLPKVGHGFGAPRNWDPQFVEAYGAVLSARAPHAPPPAAAAVSDLPLVEVPATGTGDLMAVMATGDGGWAEIDRSIAEKLAEAGVPTVGWNSLDYYWTPRTPAGASADLARILRHYQEAWHRPRVLLVGYSFGADVLPYLVNGLPPELQKTIAGVGLLGLSPNADFEFHVTAWLDLGGDRTHPTGPEVARMTVPVACVRGADETDSECPGLRGAHVHQVVVPGSHHFNGDYAGLAGRLLSFAREPR